VLICIFNMNIWKLDECEFYVQVCGLSRSIFWNAFTQVYETTRKEWPHIETYIYLRIFAVAARMTQRLPACLHTELIERAERWNWGLCILTASGYCKHFYEFYEFSLSQGLTVQRMKETNKEGCSFPHRKILLVCRSFWTFPTAWSPYNPASVLHSYQLQGGCLFIVRGHFSVHH
jgi:hypothetical protein